MSWSLRPAWSHVVGWGWWLASGAAAIAIAWSFAPRSRRADPLSGLARDEAPAVSAVAAPALGRTGRPLVAAALAVLAVVLLGGGWAGLAEARRGDSFLASLAPRPVEVIGTLREDPRPGAYGWHVVLAASEARWEDGAVQLREAIWVEGDEAPGGVARGDLVRVSGRLQIPEEAGFRESLAGRGAAAVLRADTVERLGPSPNPFVRATQATRNVVGDAIERVLPPREAGLLLGLALGDDAHLDPATERDFQATGLTHLLVVSGGNVAMLILPVLLLAKALRLARVGTALAGIIGVAFIVILTGAEPSVLRAGTMSVIALVGVLAARPRSTGVILSAAVLVLLVLDPGLATSVGFQLSAAATGGLVALASPLGERLSRVLPRAVGLAFGTTLAAQLGVTPVLLFHFGDVPLVTLARERAGGTGRGARAPAGLGRRRGLPGVAAARRGARRRRADPDALPGDRRERPGQGAGGPRHVARRSARAAGRRPTRRGAGVRAPTRAPSAARGGRGVRRGPARSSRGPPRSATGRPRP